MALGVIALSISMLSLPLACRLVLRQPLKKRLFIANFQISPDADVIGRPQVGIVGRRTIEA